MPVEVIESKRNRGAVQSAIDEFQTATAPTSIDQINSLAIGPNRAVHTIIYTA